MLDSIQSFAIMSRLGKTQLLLQDPVVRDVDPGTIVGGNQAKVIGYVDDIVAKRKALFARYPYDRWEKGCDRKAFTDMLWLMKSDGGSNNQ